MRVMVYKAREGQYEVVVIPSKSARKPPISLRGQSKQAVMAELEEVLKTLKPIPSEPRG